MKSILLNVNEDDGCASRLQAALDVARGFGSHISCVQVTPYDNFVLGDPFGGIYALPTVVEELREAEQAQRSRIEAQLRAEGVAWDWTHYDGQPAQVLVDRSRLTDLIVLSIPDAQSKDVAPISLTGDVALHSRAPLLAVPRESSFFEPFGNAIVAWNGSMESGNALRLSLEMLKKAAAVHVVTVCDQESEFPSTDACEYLARHGIKSQLHEWPHKGRVGSSLLEAASAHRGSYIVAGAYGHSRFRETVLGGVTRDLLAGSKLPLLLAH